MMTGLMDRRVLLRIPYTAELSSDKCHWGEYSAVITCLSNLMPVDCALSFSTDLSVVMF